jgi:hypothetical protein
MNQRQYSISPDGQAKDTDGSKSQQVRQISSVKECTKIVNPHQLHHTSSLRKKSVSNCRLLDGNVVDEETNTTLGDHI